MLSCLALSLSAIPSRSKAPLSLKTEVYFEANQSSVVPVAGIGPFRSRVGRMLLSPNLTPCIERHVHSGGLLPWQWEACEVVDSGKAVFEFSCQISTQQCCSLCGCLLANHGVG